MFAMLSKFWSMLHALFVAGEAAANALAVVSKETEAMAQGWADEQRLEREAKLKLLKNKPKAITE